MVSPIRLRAERISLPFAARAGSRGLSDLSLDLAPGRWTAIVGPNGAGKSTLLRVLAGLQVPASGTVTLDGRPLARWSARERACRISWLAQQSEAEGELRVRDVVGLGRLPWLGLLAGASDDDARCIERAMTRVDCSDLADRRLSSLSGGERQRALIARAVAVAAPVLLLDEPAAHLDPPHQRALLRLLREECAAGATVVTVLHELSLALAADRLVVLKAGQSVAEGSPSDPALQATLEAVFGGAIRIEPTRAGLWAVALAP